MQLQLKHLLHYCFYKISHIYTEHYRNTYQKQYSFGSLERAKNKTLRCYVK